MYYQSQQMQLSNKFQKHSNCCLARMVCLKQMGLLLQTCHLEQSSRNINIRNRSIRLELSFRTSNCHPHHNICPYIQLHLCINYRYDIPKKRTSISQIRFFLFSIQLPSSSQYHKYRRLSNQGGRNTIIYFNLENPFYHPLPLSIWHFDHFRVNLTMTYKVCKA